MLRKGYYRTKGNLCARLDVDLVTRGSIAILSGIGYVAYDKYGIFPYKENFPEIGDAFDLVAETWQEENFTEEERTIPMSGVLHETVSTLTDAEWMSLINKNSNALPACCGNISDLREQIISIAREGCKLAPWNGMAYLRAYRVARDGHDFTDEIYPALMKLTREVAESMGFTLEDVHHLPHEGNGE